MFDVYREEKDQLVSVFSKEGDLIVSMAPLSSYNGRLLNVERRQRVLLSGFRLYGWAGETGFGRKLQTLSRGFV